jgi:hypothetical protein
MTPHCITKHPKNAIVSKSFAIKIGLVKLLALGDLMVHICSEDANVRKFASEAD